MHNLAQAVRIDPSESLVSRSATPAAESKWQGWSATFKPQQPRSVFPQLDIYSEDQSCFAEDALERRIVPSEYYDLILDMGLQASARQVQFGSQAVYRYLLWDGRVCKGVTYRPFVSLDGEKYYVPNSEVLGFKVISLALAAEERDVLVSAQSGMAELEVADIERVAAAVEWFKES